MGPKFRGTLPPKTPKIAPEKGVFHLKFKGGGRFGRKIRQNAWIGATGEYLCGTKYMGDKFGVFYPQNLYISPK